MLVRLQTPGHIDDAHHLDPSRRASLTGFRYHRISVTPGDGANQKLSAHRAASAVARWLWGRQARFAGALHGSWPHCASCSGQAFVVVQQRPSYGLDQQVYGMDVSGRPSKSLG